MKLLIVLGAFGIVFIIGRTVVIMAMGDPVAGTLVGGIAGIIAGMLTSLMA